MPATYSTTEVYIYKSVTSLFESNEALLSLQRYRMYSKYLVINPSAIDTIRYFISLFSGQTSEVVTLSMQTQVIDDTFATTHRQDDYLSSLDNDYVTKGRLEDFLKTTDSDDSTTPTVKDDILRTENAPEDVQVNKNDDNETTTAEMTVTSLNFTTSSELQTDKIDKGVHVTEYRSTSDTEVVEDATTMTHALTNPVKGHDTTSPFPQRQITTDVLHVETTTTAAAAATPTMTTTATTVDEKSSTKSVMTTPKMSTVVKTTTLQQQNVEPISAVVDEEAVNFEDQKSNKVSYNGKLLDILSKMIRFVFFSINY